MSLRIESFGQSSVSDTHADWRPALDAWARLMDAYIAIHDDDPAPFAYNERTNVGLLSGGILRASADAVTLEEYAVGKESGKGRADLWAIVGDYSYLVEAKHGWSSCQNGKPFFDEVNLSSESGNRTLREVLDLALAKARTYDDDPDFHVAAAFVVPYITAGQATGFEDAWEDVVAGELGAGPHSGLVAWYRQDERDVDVDGDFNRYPGVVLVLSFRRNR